MIAGVALAWSVDRAAGIAAMVLAGATLVVGLLQVDRSARRHLAPLEHHALHEGLSIAALVALAIHGLAVAFDPFLHAGLLPALIPFDVSYRPVATGIGQLAGYGLVALGLSFYLRRRIGTARWRAAHRVIPVFWALGVLHGLLDGTDAGRWWFLAAALPPVVVGVAVLARRWDEPMAADPAPSARRPARGGPARGPARPTRTAAGGSRAGR